MSLINQQIEYNSHHRLQKVKVSLNSELVASLTAQVNLHLSKQLFLERQPLTLNFDYIELTLIYIRNIAKRHAVK